MIYLNNAATSFPKPDIVINQVSRFLNLPPFEGKRGGKSLYEFDIEKIREKIAAFFNVPSSNQLIFTSGATESLNLVIKGLLNKGDHVVTTAIEHNSVLRPLHELKNEKIIDLEIIPCDDCGWVEPSTIKQKLNKRTKLVVISQASNVTGTVQDTIQIARDAHFAGAYCLVDLSQSAGAIDFNFGESEVDFAAFTGHKSLFGLQGCGGLIIKKGLEIRPIKTGGTGIRSDLLLQPPEWPVLFESGTPNVPGIVSMSEGISFINQVGIDHIEARKQELTCILQKKLEKIDDISFPGLNTGKKQLAILNIAFNENCQIEEVAYILENSFNIYPRTGLHCAPLIHQYIGSVPHGTIRISPGYFTQDEELDLLVDALEEVVKAIA